MPSSRQPGRLGLALLLAALPGAALPGIGGEGDAAAVAAAAAGAAGNLNAVGNGRNR